MSKISILIPSLRPEKISYLSRYLKDNVSIDYQLVVVSPFEMDLVNTDFIKEEKPEGIYKAVKKGMSIVNGEYVLHMPDDAFPVNGSIESMLKFSESFTDKLFLGSWVSICGGFVFEQGSYYDIPFSAYPFMKRSDIDQLGILMDTYYDSFYGDPDLALRVNYVGGRIKVCPNAWMHINSPLDGVKSESLKKYEESDKDKFICRWKPIFGEFRGYQPCETQVVSFPK